MRVFKNSSWFLAGIVFFTLSFTERSHAAETLKSDHVKISWLAPNAFSKTLGSAAIYFEIDPEWHIYYKNPGDSGAAPKFQFTTSDNITTPTSVSWPIPHRLPFGDLTNIGYEDAVAFEFTLTPKYPLRPPKDFVEMSIKLEWLVCKEECIPGFGTLTLKRPIKQKELWNTTVQKRFISFMDDNQPIEQSSWQAPQITRTLNGITVKLNLNQGELLDKKSAPELIPTGINFMAATKPTIENISTGYKYDFKLVPGADDALTTGLLVVEGKYAFEFTDIPVSAPEASPLHAPESLALLLLFAFLGGILLNLMPCVFPVMALKFYSLVKQESTLRQRLLEAWLYTAGVLLTFLALGATLLALRTSGSALGWGFQLQNPLVILALILIFWLMALNFFGLFEFGTTIMNRAGRPQTNSSFMVGILSVFVAAPCTGPFMGTALGAAATLPPASALAIFAGLGLGLAAPFLIFAVSPSLLALLPRPGGWMETFKQFLAFPLLATAIWLMWVLGTQLGDTAWVLSTTLLLLSGFVIWLMPHVRGRFWRIILWIICGIGIAKSFGFVYNMQRVAQNQNAQTSLWHPYNKSEIDQMRGKSQPVFIDYTAAWCITCQVNKRAVLETGAAEKIFTDNNVYLVRADWTNSDPAITSALVELGRNSVPTYVYYSGSSSPPKILPQILTLSIIESALTQP